MDRAMSRWLLICGAVVGVIVVVGGVTRLTESGLSIVKWKPLSGIRPPLTSEEWELEFDGYKKFPEFKQKPDMTLSDFKYIFFWEWLHRALARSMGIVFGVPLLYFAAKGALKGRGALQLRLAAALLLGAGQGALGWYMVKSGLDHQLTERSEKATVSPYRLASHLTMAFTIFSVLLATAFRLQLATLSLPEVVHAGVQSTTLLPGLAKLSLGTMFVTAVSGAFVAGLDAGLFFNDTFPYMGEGWFPVAADCFAKSPLWRNIFENPVAAQLWHRIMAGATTISVLLLNAEHHRLMQLPETDPAGLLARALKGYIRGVNHALLGQVTLGMAAIVTSVYLPIAALHQLNSMVLLGILLRLVCMLGFRRPL